MANEKNASPSFDPEHLDEQGSSRGDDRSEYKAFVSITLCRVPPGSRKQKESGDNPIEKGDRLSRQALLDDEGADDQYELSKILFDLETGLSILLENLSIASYEASVDVLEEAIEDKERNSIQICHMVQTSSEDTEERIERSPPFSRESQDRARALVQSQTFPSAHQGGTFPPTSVGGQMEWLPQASSESPQSTPREQHTKINTENLRDLVLELNQVLQHREYLPTDVVIHQHLETPNGVEGGEKKPHDVTITCPVKEALAQELSENGNKNVTVSLVINDENLPVQLMMKDGRAFSEFTSSSLPSFPREFIENRVLSMQKQRNTPFQKRSRRPCVCKHLPIEVKMTESFEHIETANQNQVLRQPISKASVNTPDNITEEKQGHYSTCKEDTKSSSLASKESGVARITRVESEEHLEHLGECDRMKGLDSKGDFTKSLTEGNLLQKGEDTQPTTTEAPEEEEGAYFYNHEQFSAPSVEWTKEVFSEIDTSECFTYNEGKQNEQGFSQESLNDFSEKNIRENGSKEDFPCVCCNLPSAESYNITISHSSEKPVLLASYIPYMKRDMIRCEELLNTNHFMCMKQKKYREAKDEDKDSIENSSLLNTVFTSAKTIFESLASISKTTLAKEEPHPLSNQELYLDAQSEVDRTFLNITPSQLMMESTCTSRESSSSSSSSRKSSKLNFTGIKALRPKFQADQEDAANSTYVLPTMGRTMGEQGESYDYGIYKAEDFHDYDAPSGEGFPPKAVALDSKHSEKKIAPVNSKAQHPPQRRVRIATQIMDEERKNKFEGPSDYLKREPSKENLKTLSFSEVPHDGEITPPSPNGLSSDEEEKGVKGAKEEENLIKYTSTETSDQLTSSTLPERTRGFDKRRQSSCPTPTLNAPESRQVGIADGSFAKCFASDVKQKQTRGRSSESGEIPKQRRSTYSGGSSPESRPIETLPYVSKDSTDSSDLSELELEGSIETPSKVTKRRRMYLWRHQDSYKVNESSSESNDAMTQVSFDDEFPETAKQQDSSHKESHATTALESELKLREVVDLVSYSVEKDMKRSVSLSSDDIDFYFDDGQHGDTHTKRKPINLENIDAEVSSRRIFPLRRSQTFPFKEQYSPPEGETKDKSKKLLRFLSVSEAKSKLMSGLHAVEKLLGDEADISGLKMEKFYPMPHTKHNVSFHGYKDFQMKKEDTLEEEEEEEGEGQDEEIINGSKEQEMSLELSSEAVAEAPRVKISTFRRSPSLNEELITTRTLKGSVKNEAKFKSFDQSVSKDSLYVTISGNGGFSEREVIPVPQGTAQIVMESDQLEQAIEVHSEVHGGSLNSVQHATEILVHPAGPSEPLCIRLEGTTTKTLNIRTMLKPSNR